MLQTQLANERNKSSETVAKPEGERVKGEDWKRKYQQLTETLEGVTRVA
jgi:hypothetical protein